MDSEKWRLDVPVSARGGAGTVSLFLSFLISSPSRTLRNVVRARMGSTSGPDTVGRAVYGVRVVAPSKQGGGLLALCRLLCCCLPLFVCEGMFVFLVG